MSALTRNLVERLMELFGLYGRYFRTLYRHGFAQNPYRGQGRILKLLRLQPEISQKELAEILDIRPQSLSETLAKLEKNGLVTRSPSEADRRSTVVRLTEAGREAGAEEPDAAEGLFSGLTQEEQEQLNALLEKLCASLREQCGAQKDRHFRWRHSFDAGRGGEERR